LGVLTRYVLDHYGYVAAAPYLLDKLHVGTSNSGVSSVIYQRKSAISRRQSSKVTFFGDVLRDEPDVPAVEVAVAPRGELSCLLLGEELTYNVLLAVEHHP
jgi:hypothetical protein